MYFSAFVCMPLMWSFVGENNSCYSIFPVTIRRAGCYCCEVKNQYGRVRSNTAAVVVSTLQPTNIPSVKNPGIALPGIALPEMQSGNFLSNNKGHQMQDPILTDLESQ